jgi:hypothetical protein
MAIRTYFFTAQVTTEDGEIDELFSGTYASSDLPRLPHWFKELEEHVAQETTGTKDTRCVLIRTLNLIHEDNDC